MQPDEEVALRGWRRHVTAFHGGEASQCRRRRRLGRSQPGHQVPAEADDLLRLADSNRNRNPFTYIALGDLSLRYGRLDEAERFYHRARRLGPDEAAPAAALGEVLFRQGERRAAEKLLRRAQRLQPEGDRRIDRLARLLAGA